MADTIELLESIGRNASLRHASASDLGKMLDDMQASDELKRSASSGNLEHLKMELGDKSMTVNHSTNGSCEEDEEEGNSKPDQDDDGNEKS